MTLAGDRTTDRARARDAPPRRVVLAGSGHAHLEVVRRARAFGDHGVELVLIDPGRFWYSGCGSALLGGRVTPDEATVDPRALAEAAGASFVRDRVVGLDRDARTAILGSGRRLGYDLLSLNIGSRVRPPPGFDAVGAVSVKPLAGLPPLKGRLTAAPAAAAQRIVVIGGGATGCEIAGNLLHLGATGEHRLEVALVTAAARLVPDAPAGLGARALRSLTRRGAHVHLSSPAGAVEAGLLTLGSGARLPFDHLILATGLEADPALESFGLPLRAGGLRVEATLRSVADARIFAAGDCAAIEGHDLPKAGVYGVREGPVLLGNLLASLDGRPLRAYRPQAHALSIIDLADGKALATRAGFWMESRLALALKTHLDRRFLRRYRRIDAPGRA